MDVKIMKGTNILDCHGLYENGKVFLPAEALDSFVGLWQGTAFYKSPLAGKRLCITVLSPDTFADALPPALEYFLDLCSAAGAQLIYHDGGRFPESDLIIAVEPGGTHTYVKYIGAAFRSRPLAARIAANIKRGLKLAYLPDPIAFNKPQFNLKMSLFARLFTPAVALQWPGNLDTLGAWLFTSLMEYFGTGKELNGAMFIKSPVPAVESESRHIAPQPQPEPQAEHRPYRESAQAPGISCPVPALAVPGRESRPDRERTRTGGTGISASLSQSQYPGLFDQLKREHKPIKKEPFT